MERSIAVSADTVGSVGLYSSVVTTAPGGKTRIHHHGECETSIFIVSGRARYTWGPTGLEEARVGGWGIPLVRRFSDGWRYHRSEGRNCLTLLFRDNPNAQIATS